MKVKCNSSAIILLLLSLIFISETVFSYEMKAVKHRTAVTKEMHHHDDCSQSQCHVGHCLHVVISQMDHFPVCLLTLKYNLYTHDLNDHQSPYLDGPKRPPRLS